MDAHLTLRPGLPSDVEAMHRLDLICFEPPYRFDLRTMRRCATAPRSISLVVEYDSMIVGFVLLLDGYISTLDVHPNYRRRGLARRLLQAAEAATEAASGADSLLLHVSGDNLPAIAFYESFGFVRQKRIKNFYAAGIDAFEYVKPIVSPTL